MQAEVKKWLQQILEILMAERGKDERAEQTQKLDAVINDIGGSSSHLSATPVLILLLLHLLLLGSHDVALMTLI